MTELDEWVVIGGKGKPRKQRGPAAAAAQPSPESAAAAAAAAPPPPPPPVPPTALPGWTDDGPTARSSSSNSSNRRRRTRAARTPEERVHDLLSTLDDCRRELASTPMFAHLRAAMAAVEARTLDTAAPWRWQSVRHLVIYGLGCVEDSRVSRHQLALALLLRELLPGLAGPPQLFDPAFTDVDSAVLRALGMEVIREDERGARAVEAPTLFYLPHLEVCVGG